MTSAIINGILGGFIGSLIVLIPTSVWTWWECRRMDKHCEQLQREMDYEIEDDRQEDMRNLRDRLGVVLAAMKDKESSMTCHCGRPLHYGYDNNPTHHRGMCEECDLVRCDAYPDECPYREDVCRMFDEEHAKMFEARKQGDMSLVNMLLLWAKDRND